MTTTETPPEIGREQKQVILPPWSVILHNDDHNDMLHVVRSLTKSVPNLGTPRATRIMLEAHNHGQALVTTGQWAYLTGQANPLPVPFGYSSPLLTTVEQCTLAARTVLARKQRQAILRRFTITCTPDPTIQLGDPVAITTGTLSGLLCTVEAFTLPYVPGMMTMTVVSTT